MAAITTDRALELAYLAGVIDSDGHISVHKRIHRGKPYFYSIVGITGTRSQPHELAASIWGGNIWSHQPKNPDYRRVFQWARQGQIALEIISGVLPYLRIKRPQAELALTLYAAPDKDAVRNKMMAILNQDRRRRGGRILSREETVIAAQNCLLTIASAGIRSALHEDRGPSPPSLQLPGP